MHALNSNTLDEYKTFLKKLNPKIGCFGGRFYKFEGKDITFKLNDIVRAFQRIIKNPSQSTDDTKINAVIKEIRNLDQKAQNQLEKKSLIIKIVTFIRQFFGNLFFDKYKVLKEIQFSKQKLATSVGNYRLLPLKGEIGSVSCRVRGISGNLFPTLSEHGVAEFYSRSVPRLRNLVAVRGSEEGARMVGPCDYYGNLEKPYEHKYTIQINDGVPAFIHHEKKMKKSYLDGIGNHSILSKPLAPLTLQAEWISGANEEILNINDNVFGESLFKRKGILKITGGTAFELEEFDASAVDLSDYKARLVKNSTPFQISNKIISPEDDYRVVSYLYEPEYANHQVQKGGGLFLETHSFPQTITPMDINSMGFVTLAKWTDESKRQELEVVAVEIPFGYTLIVEEFCIHGDTNLNGMFMMGMTSSHESMQTADTVFLKNSEDMQNISLSIKNSGKQKLNGEEKKSHLALLPIVNFENK